MTKKQTTAARRARARTRVNGQKYTDALREVLRETPATALVRCMRDASLAEQAAVLASYTCRAREMELERLAADDPNYDPGPGADQFGLTFDERLFESVFAALVAAATRPVPVELLAAAAGVLESFYVGYAADVIRGQVLGSVPVALETTVAQLACAAAGVWVMRTSRQVGPVRRGAGSMPRRAGSARPWRRRCGGRAGPVRCVDAQNSPTYGPRVCGARRAGCPASPGRPPATVDDPPILTAADDDRADVEGGGVRLRERRKICG